MIKIIALFASRLLGFHSCHKTIRLGEGKPDCFTAEIFKVRTVLSNRKTFG